MNLQSIVNCNLGQHHISLFLLIECFKNDYLAVYIPHLKKCVHEDSDQKISGRIFCTNKIVQGHDAIIG